MAKQTALYNFHQKQNGKLVEFAGWDLPVRYQSAVNEHHAVRNAAGLFDVSHMGELLVEGPEAEKFLNYVSCNDISKLYDGKAIYSAILNESGGVIDDIIIYRNNSNSFFICVNASNSDIDYAWLLKQNSFDCKLSNLSSEYAQLALQGPKSEIILERLIPGISALKYFHFHKNTYAGKEVIVARTGYTGEDGFEIFVPQDLAEQLAYALLEGGTDEGLIPCGLAARDSLRLEASYPLHGHELASDCPALYSGLAWIIKFDKENFIGKQALLDLKTKGLERKLIGIEVSEPGIVREGTELFGDGKALGIVTSGTMTPTINKSIAMAIVDISVLDQAREITARVRGKDLKCVLVKLPFYKRS